MWKSALDDAAVCVQKDNKFIKGYYRLATAQTEMKLYEDAETTLKAAIQLEPDNEQLVKQLKLVKTKRVQAAAASADKLVKKAPKQLDNAQLKELQELYEQNTTYSRDLKGVSTRIFTVQREMRQNEITASQVNALTDDVPMYRAVGKAFVHNDKPTIVSFLEKEKDSLSKTSADLISRKEFLERRIQSNSQNIQDLAGSRSG
jgi:chaperonin cofactor prefoldin